MARTLDDDLSKNIKHWPLDWDLHIIKASKFYFEEPKIPFIKWVSCHSVFNAITPTEFGQAGYAEIRDGIDINSIHLRVVLSCNDEFFYLAYFTKDHDTSVIANVFYVIEYVLESDNALIQPVGFLRGRSAYECMEKLEACILEDYWRRRGGEGGEKEPQIEPSPEPVLELLHE